MSSILIPFINQITPSFINNCFLVLLDGSIKDVIKQKAVDMMMSSEINRERCLSDAYEIYITSTILSRFQCENLLFRSPSGSFLFRNPHPYSDYIILSFHADDSISHKIFYKKQNGYENGYQFYPSLLSVIESYQTQLFYGIRLDQNCQVIAIDTMPWFTNRRVKEVRSRFLKEFLSRTQIHF